jgi:hypothetical protein
MKLEKKIDSLQKQAAVVRYVRSPLGGLVRPLPTGQQLRRGQSAWFIINAN